MKKEKMLNAIGQIDDDFILEAKPEAVVRQNKIKPQWFALLAACLVLVICISIAMPLTLGNKEAGKVTMEINPGVEFTIARNGSVKAVRFLNDDAEGVLGALQLKGYDLKNAIALTISAYNAGGYMDRNDTVLVSFSKQLGKNKKLQKSVSKDVQAALEETGAVNTLVYVNESESKETAKIAQKYSVSEGKAKLIEEASKVSDLTADELAKLPLDELVGLQKNVDSRVIARRFIGISRAKQIALQDSGCVNRVTFTEAILIDGGIKTPYYRLTFNDRQTEWTYRIDATSGAIMEKSKAVFFISLEDAKKIALKYANVGVEEKVVFTKEELNRNQGKPCWMLEFYTEKYQYGYNIDATSGEVIFKARYINVEVARKNALKHAGVVADIEKITFTTEELIAGGVKTPYFIFVFNNQNTRWTYRIDATSGAVMHSNAEPIWISLEQAKEIAFLDANLPESIEVVFTNEVLSRNQGRPCWVLEFHTKRHQYSYKIDVNSGEVIAKSQYIYIERAKEIALADVFGAVANKVTFTVEELIELERAPYFYFVFNDGETQWSYYVDAANGTILLREKETYAAKKSTI